MRIKDGFIVRNIANSWLAVPVGVRTAEVSGIISLTETGAFLWELLSAAECDVDTLVLNLTEMFDVEKDIAENDVAVFINNLREMDLLDGRE